jgi:hypothetical protein
VPNSWCPRGESDRNSPLRIPCPAREAPPGSSLVSHARPHVTGTRPPPSPPATCARVGLSTQRAYVHTCGGAYDREQRFWPKVGKHRAAARSGVGISWTIILYCSIVIVHVMLQTPLYPSSLTLWLSRSRPHMSWWNWHVVNPIQRPYDWARLLNSLERFDRRRLGQPWKIVSTTVLVLQ